MARLTRKTADSLLRVIDGRYSRCEAALSKIQHAISLVERELFGCAQTTMTDPVMMQIATVRAGKLKNDLKTLKMDRARLKEDMKREFARRALMIELVNQSHNKRG